VSLGGEERSTLDLFGRRFVVLAGAEGDAWSAAASAAAAELGVELDAYRLGAGLEDRCGAVAELYGIGPRGAALVRPDGFVAWRASAAAADADRALRQALGAALARPQRAV